MARKAKEEKKNNIVSGIILLVVGLLALIFGENYLWVLFGVIEIPLQIAGGVFAALGVILTIVGIREKKKEKQASANQEQQ